eukprot:2273350-Prorocentrum_lima.AAC.1
MINICKADPADIADGEVVELVLGEEDAEACAGERDRALSACAGEVIEAALSDDTGSKHAACGGLGEVVEPALSDSEMEDARSCAEIVESENGSEETPSKCCAATLLKQWGVEGEADDIP